MSDEEKQGQNSQGQEFSVISLFFGVSTGWAIDNSKKNLKKNE